MMSWILTLLKNLPQLLAAIQAIMAIFTGKAAYQSHVHLSPAIASGVASAATDWNWYVLGQGGATGALAFGAIGCYVLQKYQNQMAASHSLLERSREMRELEERLSAEIESLPASMQTKLASRISGK